MKPRIQWGRLLRRSLALFLATLAVWALLVCSGEIIYYSWMNQ